MSAIHKTQIVKGRLKEVVGKLTGDADFEQEGRENKVTGLVNQAIDKSSSPAKNDPEDQAFGATAARDQALVDSLAEAGVTEEELPDEPVHDPRPGGKAEPI